MLFARKLKAPAHKHEHASGRARRLAIDCGDVMLALLESQAVQLIADGLCALDLFPFEWQHGAFLIQCHERRPIRVELRVVMLHERFAQAVGIHSCQRQLLPSQIPPKVRVPILIYTLTYGDDPLRVQSTHRSLAAKHSGSAMRTRGLGFRPRPLASLRRKLRTDHWLPSVQAPQCSHEV